MPHNKLQKRHSHQQRYHANSTIMSPTRGELIDAAEETRRVLETVLRELRTEDDAHNSTKHSFDSPSRLDPNKCPSYAQPATIKVVNEDTLNAAIGLASADVGDDVKTMPLPGSKSGTRRPAIVNFANHRTPGGGWLTGAMAQEEAICYRSSLALSLNRRHYPLAMGEGLYSPYVLVMRHDLAKGHSLLVPDVSPSDLPVVSALTIAAIYRPEVRVFEIKDGSGDGEGSEPRPPREKWVYARDRDRNITKSKMRLALRMAAFHGHDQLVLGALGCGVFENPPEDVAHCWLEVLREDEFSGNWWREVCFAVFDPKDDGNYEIFHKLLSGKTV